MHRSVWVISAAGNYVGCVFNSSVECKELRGVSLVLNCKTHSGLMLLACVVVFCCLSTVLFLLHLQNGHRCSSPVVCLKWDFLWDISTGLWRQQVLFGVLVFFWCRKRFSLYSSEFIDYCCFWNVSNKESLFCCCIFGFFPLTFCKLSSCFLFLLWRVWSRHCSFVLKKSSPSYR